MDIRTGYFKRCVIALFALLALPALAVTEVTGNTPGGAAYRIAVPDGWQAGGPLVLVQHAYSHSRVTDPTLGALRDTQLAQGMAVAASGYRQGGWALFTALEDNSELLAEFENRFGTPGLLYTTGNAMGALIALKLAEDPRFTARTRGVLAMCPIVDGVQQWDDVFDVRLVYDAVCAGVGGGELPPGTNPTPWALDLGAIPMGLGSFDDPRVIDALPQVTACTGLGLPAQSRSEAQRARLARLTQATGLGGEKPLIAMLAYATFGLGDLLRAPDKLGGENAFFNEMDAPFRLRRVPYPTTLGAIPAVREYDLFSRQRFDRSSRLDGSATARIVAITTGLDEQLDQYQITGLNGIYRRHLGERLYAQVNDADAPSHCGFSRAESLAAWDALTASNVAVPTLGERCVARAASGQGGPCRFASLLTVPLDGHVGYSRFTQPPLYDSGVVKSSSGLWFDPARDGEGLVIEELGAPIAGGGGVGVARHVLVSWYTFAPPGDPDPGPRWLIGVGTHTNQGVVVPALTQAHGARFGSEFDPDDVVRSNWGRLALVIDPFHRMRVRYNGPPGWEGSERAMTMLARVDFWQLPRYYYLVSPPIPTPPPGLESASGAYFAPERNGEGVQIQVLAGTTVGTRRATVQFFTYDLVGNPLWLVGLAENVPAAGGEATFAMTRADGTVFGDTFNPSDVTRTPWGTLTLTLAPDPDPTGGRFAGFSATAMRWESVQAGYGSGGYALTRITQPHVYLEHAPTR